MDKLIDVDKVAEYTMKLVDTLTPVAKKAYEIGLLTLQIDAAQKLLFGLVLVLGCAITLKRVARDYSVARKEAAKPENARRWDKDGAENHLPMDGGLHFMGGLLGICGAAFGFALLLNVWTWTKLFAPELWLAHMAIEKLIN